MEEKQWQKKYLAFAKDSRYAGGMIAIAWERADISLNDPQEYHIQFLVFPWGNANYYLKCTKTPVSEIGLYQTIHYAFENEFQCPPEPFSLSRLDRDIDSTEIAKSIMAGNPHPRPRKPPAKGVYFAESDGYVKIGYSTDVDRRMESLQTMCPHGIKLLHVEPGTMQTEKEWHRAYAEYRHNGEWFKIPKAMVGQIEKNGPAEAFSIEEALQRIE